MSLHGPVRKRLACTLGAVGLWLVVSSFPVGARAQGAAAETPLKEIEVAAGAFVRGAPLPGWADLLPVPAPPPADARPSVLVRLHETAVRVGSPTVRVRNLAVQVHDAGALGQIGQLELVFNPQFQTLRLHRLTILRGERRIDHLTSARVRFLQRESALEAGVYSGLITASVVLPDVRVGDTLHLTLSIEGDNPIFGSRYSDRMRWQETHPMLLSRVTVWAPRERPLQWRWIGGSGGAGPRPSETVEGGWRRLRFEERGLPGASAEPMMPPHLHPQRWLQFTEYASWNEVARWALTLFPADAPLPEEMAAVLARLRALPDPQEQVSQALQWVQNEIRHWSISLGEGALRPQLPAEVLRRRYGDCKDKTLLLTRMLRELGIDARPALASAHVGRGPGTMLPTPDAFDHAIVQVRLGGREHYLDPTRVGQSGLLRRMGQHLEDAQVLPVDAQTQGLVSVHSPNRAEIFRQQIREQFSLAQFDAEGRLEVEFQWAGLSAEVLRVAIQRMDAAQRRSFVSTTYEGAYPGIRLIGEPSIDDDRRLTQLTVRAHFAVPALAREFGGSWLVAFTPGLQGAFALPRQTARRFPVVVPSYPTTIVYEAQMTWPDNVAAAADPQAHRLETPHFQLRTTRTFRGNVERRTVTFVPRVAEVPAAELARLKDDLHTLERLVGGTMVVDASDIAAVAPTGPRPNAALENLRRQLKVQIERADHLLADGALADEDRATALCSRALARTHLGAPAEGLHDALAAARAAERSGYVWGCLGSVHFALGEFAKAAAAYTRALPLADSPEGVYFRRGHARFYEGRLAEAADDFARSAAANVDESDRLYAQLWQAWTLQRLGRALPAALAAAAAQDPRGDWPRPALAMLAGLLSADDVLAQLQRKQGDERELDLAEGWFYIGQHRLVQRRPAQAREAFENVLAKGVTMYVEHVAAGIELRRLDAAR